MSQLTNSRLVGVITFVSIIAILALNYTAANLEPLTAPRTIAAERALNPKRQLSPIQLQARAAIVYDPTVDAVLFEQTSNLPLPLASLSKIMTALVALERNPADTPINFFEEAATTTWPLSQFLARMLVGSSNNAASAVAALTYGSNRQASTSEIAFVRAMNLKARELGLSRTFFRNPTGLDLDDSTTGGEGTAREVAAMLWYGLQTRPELFSATSRQRLIFQNEDGTHYGVLNTNQILKVLPPVLASKTGLTDLAGGNLALIIDIGINHPVVTVVLGSTEQARFSDSQELLQAIFSYYASDLK